MGDLTENYSDCFVRWSGDAKAVARFVEVRSGAGVKEGGFYKL